MIIEGTKRRTDVRETADVVIIGTGSGVARSACSWPSAAGTS
jgi:hypothetical protein